MTAKEKQNCLAIKAWVFFCFNFYDIDEIINYICEKANNHIENHLKQKFSEIYDRVGSRAAMNVFYTELGRNLRDALVDYAVKVYAPQGLILTDEDNELLGI